MSVLDDIKEVMAIDKADMYRAIASFPEQVHEAVAIGTSFEFDGAKFQDIDAIVLCGMGGSAIGGDLARSILLDTLKIPFYVCRNYNLPAFAGPDTLVIASSYSGNTEETLTAFSQACKRNCRLMAITTGGKLGQVTNKHKLPTIKIPGGLQPRAALGFSFVPLMIFLNRIGHSPFDADVFGGMAAFLKHHLPGFALENATEVNVCKQLAMRIKDKLPIIYAGPEVFDTVAVRFKGQICENAKCLAFCNQFPELNHNELVGWELADKFREKTVLIVLRDHDDNQRIKIRMDVTEGFIAERDFDVIEIQSNGDNRIERVFSLIQIADLTSFYLAILNGVDPTPVKPIDFLKNELSKTD